MAVTAATLTSTITDSITLNGSTYGNTVTKTITNIHDVYQRIITVPTSEITLYTTADSVVGGSAFDEDFVKYVRITNTDTSNFISLVLESDGSAGSDGDEAQFKLEAGQSFILRGHKDVFNSTAEGANVTAGTFTTDQDSIKTVTAIADTAAVDVEVFIASTNA